MRKKHELDDANYHFEVEDTSVADECVLRAFQKFKGRWVPIRTMINIKRSDIAKRAELIKNTVPPLSNSRHR